jgi:1-acyl-sn-glycerol-3-phosphate acyltransferase
MSTSLLRKGIACFRAARLALHLGYGLLLAIPFPMFSSKVQRRIVRNWSAGLVCIFNMRVILPDNSAIKNLPGGLIVSNHISWLDVYVLNSVIPMRFIAKSEVRSWPVIGWLCERAQTIFIQREKRRDTARVNQEAVEVLRKGHHIAMFPEGTTTDGTQVRHFHSSLLQPAVDAGVAIRPIAIRYYDKRGELSTDANYIDQMSFLESLWKILCSPSLRVRLTDLPALPSIGVSRRILAV